MRFFAKHLLQIWIHALFPAKCAQCRCFFKPLDLPQNEHRHALMAAPDQPRPDMHGNNAGKPIPGVAPRTTDLAVIYQRQMAPFLCTECIKEFTPITSPLCSCCGAPFKIRSQTDHHCGTCLQDPPRFAKARSAAVFSGSLQTCLKAFKYNGKVQLAEPLGHLLLAAYWHSIMGAGNRGDDLVVPVPLGKNRLRTRGFNQAYLLVHKWQQVGRRESIPVPTLLDNGLLKVRQTRPQTGLDRKMRLKNVRNVFQVNRRVNLKGRAVLLVDDVYTTGATLSACTDALLAAGAERVNGLTLARRIL